MVDVLRHREFTPIALISLTLEMVGTAGEGITTARRHLGDSKTISIILK